MPVEAIRQRMLEDVHAAGFTDVVPAHSEVFRYPGPHGRRPSDLAAEAGTTRQAMNYLLGQLEQLGYLKRVDDPADKRSRLVELTERGLKLRRALRASVAAIERELQQDLGEPNFDKLRRLLVSLNGTPMVQEFRRSAGLRQDMPNGPRSGDWAAAPWEQNGS